MQNNDDVVTFKCPTCGLQILEDETPCELEYGEKCGAEMLNVVDVGDELHQILGDALRAQTKG